VALTFVLPENCWTEHYYAPLAKARELFLRKYAGNATAEELVAFYFGRERDA